MNRQESEALNITRFVMSIGIVFLHAYTSVRMYDYLGDLPVYKEVTRVISFQFGEACVPAFFVISGYLFFFGYRQTWECYKYKMKKRFFSLLLPYLFWNALMIAVFYAVECFPSVRGLFNDSRKLLHDCGLVDFLRAFWVYNDSAGPILTQLWFVRNLIVLALCSPVVYCFVRYTRIVGLFILGIWWMAGEGVPNLESSVFYFCLGAWFSISGKSLLEEVRRISIPIFILFPLIVIGDALLDGTLVGHYLHRTETFTCVFFVLALISVLLEKGKIRDIAFLSSSSFFLYVVHDPMLRFIRKFSLRYADHGSEFQMIALYFIAVAVDIAVVYAVFWLLRKYVPWFLKWTTGR